MMFLLGQLKKQLQETPKMTSNDFCKRNDIGLRALLKTYWTDETKSRIQALNIEDPLEYMLVQLIDGAKESDDTFVTDAVRIEGVIEDILNSKSVNRVFKANGIVDAGTFVGRAIKMIPFVGFGVSAIVKEITAMAGECTEDALRDSGQVMIHKSGLLGTVDRLLDTLDIESVLLQNTNMRIHCPSIMRELILARQFAQIWSRVQMGLTDDIQQGFIQDTNEQFKEVAD
jgi:hypothetical protein